MPKVSIITTTYNHKDFIKDTIESILSQTFTDWELLIWDDSPDELTWNIIKDYVKKYPDKIKAWHNSPNKWIVDNMNFLLGNISNNSEYIAFLEWDDLFNENNLEKKLRIFENNPDTMLVYSDIDIINWDGKIFIKDFYKVNKLQKIKNKEISKKDYIKIKQSLLVTWSNICIRKKIIDDIKIINITNEKKYWWSDYDFWFQVSTRYKIYWIEESLVKYRKHWSNISSDFNHMINLNNSIIDYYLKNKIIDEKLYNYKLYWLITLKSLNYIINNDKKNSFKEFKNSLKHNIFSFPIYKLAIIFFLIMPNKLNKIILNKLIKRW